MNSAVSIVIPTLGERLDLTKRLLHSLVEQSVPPTEVVIVDQSADQVCKDIAPEYPLPLSVLRAAPGLAHARNTGIRSLREPWTLVGLPDDDCFYEKHALARAIELEERSSDPIAICGLVQWLGGGSRMRLHTEAVEITPANVWRSTIEPGLFLSRPFLDTVGYFDESLGLGAQSPWGSGEGTDLLLRALRQHVARVLHDPSILVWEEPPSSRAPNPGRGRAYARGTGFVYARHYGARKAVELVLKSLARLAFSVASLSPGEMRYHAAVLLGRLEGLTAWRAARWDRTPGGISRND